MELERLARLLVLGVWVVEGRGIPLLETDFRLRAFVAEEEDVFVCDERREGLSVFEPGGEVGLVVADPARSFWHACCRTKCKESLLGGLSKLCLLSRKTFLFQATSGLRMCGEWHRVR